MSQFQSGQAAADLNIQALGPGARMHLKRSRSGELYLRSEWQIKAITFGVIALVPMASSLVMALVLDGSEARMYGVIAPLLLLLALGLLGLREHWVFRADALVRERSFYGLSARVKQRWPMAEVQLVAEPIGALEKGCWLSLYAGDSKARYSIGEQAQTQALVRALAKATGAKGFERISRWPELCPLAAADSEADIGSSASVAACNGAEGPQPGQSLAWRAGSLWLLLLPLPLFIALGFALMLLGH